MYKIAFFDTKPYDKEWFDKYAGDDLESPILRRSFCRARRSSARASTQYAPS